MPDAPCPMHQDIRREMNDLHKSVTEHHTSNGHGTSIQRIESLEAADTEHTQTVREIFAKLDQINEKLADRVPRNVVYFISFLSSVAGAAISTAIALFIAMYKRG